MTAGDFEQQLRELDRIAMPVRRRPGRETWRFAFNDKAYFVHFYPSAGRLSRGPAAKEFANLKALQTLDVPAVRVAALLSGLRFGERTGDAVLTHAVEPAVRLDDLPASQYAAARAKLIDWLAAFAKAGLGHGDLSPSSFLLAGDTLLLADAIGLSRDGLKREQLMQFAHAAGERATTADRVRAWRRLVDPERPPPPDRQTRARYSRDLLQDSVRRVRVGAWSGRFRAAGVRERPAGWSVASRLFVTPDDWQREWPRLLARLEADQLDVLKRDSGGDVLAGQATLAGVPVDVILKRPRNKFWYRYVIDAFRASRARRTWWRSLWLQARGLATEYPLAIFERRVGAYVVDAIVLYEKVPGVTLEDFDLATLPPADRETLFRRCGHALRRIEVTGLTHTDAKSSNWIVYVDPTVPDAGPVPVLIDAYGIRRMTVFLQMFGIRRLLRAMRNHPQYTRADSLNLCLGFAPRAAPGPKMRIEFATPPRRILVVKPSALGDVVHALPVLKLLRERFPEARITWLVAPAFASLLRGHRLLDEVMIFDRRGLTGWWRRPAAARALAAFTARLWREKFDLVLDLQGLFRSGWIAWVTRAATRVGFGYAREGAPVFYTHRVPQPTPDRHAVERYLDVAEALGCGRGPVEFDFSIDDAVRASVAAMLDGPAPYAVLLPGTNWPTKRWPAEKFAALVGPIGKRFGFRVVVAGGPDVTGVAIPGATSLAGRTDLKQLVALLEGASLVIANDSGPMHVAAALGRPLVTLFGPTNAVRTGPYGRPASVLQLDLVCRPCYSRTCVHQSCLRWIEVEDVLSAAAEQIGHYTGAS